MAGRSRLRFHLIKYFRRDVSSICQCGLETETVDHFLFQCPSYDSLRESWPESLQTGDLQEFTKTESHFLLLDAFAENTQRFGSSGNCILDETQADSDPDSDT